MAWHACKVGAITDYPSSEVGFHVVGVELETLVSISKRPIGLTHLEEAHAAVFDRQCSCAVAEKEKGTEKKT
jgi:hypothetical protein